MFDLKVLEEFATERGLPAERRTDDVVVIDLGCGFRLCFENCPKENDTMIYFDNTDGDWHSHGDLFIEGETDLQLVPQTVLQRLLDGSLLVSTTESPDGVIDIALEDASEAYDLTLIDEGEKQTFFRVPNKPMQTGVASPRR